MPRGVYIRTKPLIRPKRHIPPCAVSGCLKMCRSAGSVYCEKHYMRVRRHGNTDSYQRVYSRKTCEVIPHVAKDRSPPKSYAAMSAIGHPLATKGGSLRVHRFVYYEANGEGPFNCHWCSKQVTWKNLHIDHLNDEKLDNRIENLAATCGPCNMKRGAGKARLARNRTQGRFLDYSGRRMVVSDWARELNVGVSTLLWRVRKGWPIEKILSSSRAATGPKRGDYGQA